VPQASLVNQLTPRSSFSSDTGDAFERGSGGGTLVFDFVG
jgi:hypothetical protein